MKFSFQLPLRILSDSNKDVENSILILARRASVFKGTSAERPSLTLEDAGVVYLDTTIGKPIIWWGDSWKTFDGGAA